MTVSTTISKSGPYAGAGTTGPFTVGFRFLENTHLRVVRTDAAGLDTDLELTADYAVAGAGAATGTVTLVAALAAGQKLTILRNVPATQEADYVQNDAFPAESHERTLDKLTMLVQQQGEQLGRTLALPPSSSALVSAQLPAPAANTVIGWNNAGTALENLNQQLLATIVAYGFFQPDIFTGDGVTTDWNLTYSPGGLGNLDVTIGGIGQLPGTDYQWATGLILTTTTPVPNGVKMLVRYAQALPAQDSALRTDLVAPDGVLIVGNAADKRELAAPGGASLVGHLPAGVGAVATTSQVKLRERKSLLDFMSDALKTVTTAGIAYTAQNRADMLVAVNAAWTSATGATPHDLYAPAGRYELGDYSFPWRNTQYPVTSLLDCKNVTLYCDGPATVFATVSSAGADVFQLNGIKNFHVKGFPTFTASLTGTAGAGSNGCSVTNGFDNITLEICPDDCQSIDKTTYIDGGKGLSIQCDGATLEVGTLKARVMAKKCSQGFGFESGLFNFLTKKVAIDVDLVAEDCFVAVTIGGAAATGAIPAGTHTGVRVKGQAINCQKDVQLTRAHGVMVDIQTITTKTEAARQLDPRGFYYWFAADIVVEALQCLYAKNSQIIVTGNKGACAYKARIGGTTAGSSGLNGATEHCNIFLDIGGVASVIDILPVDSGGNSLSNSNIEITQTTAAALPNDFYLKTRNNTLVYGPAHRLNSPKISGRLSLANGADGVTESGAVDMFGAVTGLQGKGVSTAGAVVAGLYDNAGTLRIGILNGNGLVIDSATSSGAIGAYISKYAVYTPAGVLIGYLPIYA